MAFTDFITLGDFGFLGQLIPIIIIAAFSWGLSRKNIDFLFIQFPITLMVKVFFPLLDNAWVVLSAALFIMNIIGTKGDVISEVKSAVQTVKGVTDTFRGRSKEQLKRAFERAKLQQAGIEIIKKK